MINCFAVLKISLEQKHSDLWFVSYNVLQFLNNTEKYLDNHKSLAIAIKSHWIWTLQYHCQTNLPENNTFLSVLMFNLKMS